MYTNILNSLKKFILIGDNMNVDFYNDKFKNQPVIKCYQNEKRINEKAIPLAVGGFVREHSSLLIN